MYYRNKPIGYMNKLDCSRTAVPGQLLICWNLPRLQLFVAFNKMNDTYISSVYASVLQLVPVPRKYTSIRVYEPDVLTVDFQLQSGCITPNK